jgi:uncharacterized protein (TIGR02444 family)
VQAGTGLQTGSDGRKRKRDSMNPAPTEAFWQFTLATYARPDVSRLCIALQDRDGLDVNIMLLALYAGLVLGRRLGAEDFACLEAASALWRDRVQRPLRAVRRDLKAWSGDPDAESLRAEVQRAEIEAERLAQRHLLSALPAGSVEPPDRELAWANLRLYAGGGADALAVAATASDAAG